MKLAISILLVFVLVGMAYSVPVDPKPELHEREANLKGPEGGPGGPGGPEGDLKTDNTWGLGYYGLGYGWGGYGFGSPYYWGGYGFGSPYYRRWWW